VATRALPFNWRLSLVQVGVDPGMILRWFLDKEKMDQRRQRNEGGGSCDGFPILVVFETDMSRGCQRDRASAFVGLY
jgi:hypothetical protein